MTATTDLTIIAPMYNEAENVCKMCLAPLGRCRYLILPRLQGRSFSRNLC